MSLETKWSWVEKNQKWINTLVNQVTTIDFNDRQEIKSKTQLKFVNAPYEVIENEKALFTAILTNVRNDFYRQRHTRFVNEETGSAKEILDPYSTEFADLIVMTDNLATILTKEEHIAFKKFANGIKDPGVKSSTHRARKLKFIKKIRRWYTIEDFQ